MKSLFFEEKDVQIIDCIKETETKPKRREKKNNKRESRVENKKQKAKTSFDDGYMDTDMIFLNPLYNFEEFLLGKMPEQENSKKGQRCSGPGSGKITFLDPGFSPLFISDFTPSRSYSDGLGHRQSDIRYLRHKSYQKARKCLKLAYNMHLKIFVIIVTTILLMCPGGFNRFKTLINRNFKSFFREISYMYGPAEEQLLKMKAIKNYIVRYSHQFCVIFLILFYLFIGCFVYLVSFLVFRPNQANPVILLRGSQNNFSTNILTQHHKEIRSVNQIRP